MTVSMILLVVALILFLLATINWPAIPVNLGWLGMFFFVLAQLIGK